MKTLMKVLIFFCFAFFLVVTSDTASSEEEPGLNPGLWLLSLYRDHISPVDGDRCPSIPSCSSYAEQAFKKHGFFIGWMMTVDRLIHEGKEETSVSPFVYSEGKVKIFDPVENNDFWWYPRDGKRHE
ncbi:MAG: membrane protein insertion efficiency factor YidD [Deltaproteobacteria bacterium]|nr:MAG: membrane protein insertion efficiency factor YidD [Deltaproteobacteria bacterium]